MEETRDMVIDPAVLAAERTVVEYSGADVSGPLRALGLTVHPFAEPAEPTAQALQAAIIAQQAVLIRGLAGHWPALTEWTPSRLAARYGSTLVNPLIGLPSRGILFPHDQRRYQQTMLLAQFIEEMLSASPQTPSYLAYTRAQDMLSASDHDCAGLLGDLGTDPDTRAWIGSAGTRSMLHSDLKDNIFCQIWGRKHIVLIPWSQSRAAYPFPENIVNSRLDLAEPDLERHPRLRGTSLYAGVLEAGDVLYIPRGYWHDIRSLTPSVSLNHWFGPPLGLRDYLPLIAQLGPRCWLATARDFIRSGLLGRNETVNFFFSPPSTGKRLFDALRWGNFSRSNDPVSS